MQSARRVGRIVGLITLVRGFLAPVMNFALLGHATGAGWLTDAVANGTRVRAGLLVAFTFALLGLVIASVAAPLFRRYSERMALGFVLAAVLACATTLVEASAIAGLLSISEAHARAGAATALLASVADGARATWRWSHFANLLAGQLASLAFSAVLWRFALVPRALAGASILASLVAVAGLAMPLLGLPFRFATLAPVGIVGIVLMAWLVARGFEEREPQEVRSPSRGLAVPSP